MKKISARQRDLLLEAAQIERALTMAEERVGLLRAERVNSMRQMHDAEISWADIARTYGVTPQAAMYATGHAQRQSRKKPQEGEAKVSSLRKKKSA